MTDPLWYRAGAQVAAPINHRAAQFGDGLFETMRCDLHGQLPLWCWHRQRLQRGLVALDFPISTLSDIDQSLSHYLKQSAPCQGIKLLLSRGEGGRGYGYDSTMQPLLMLQSFTLPAPSLSPLVITISDVTLAYQPLLAGIKHLNRLEQVLARGRLQKPWDDCLLLDADGHVVESSAGNVFACFDGQWLTPDLSRCGVEGIARRWLLEQSKAQVTDIAAADLSQAEGLLICNAVRGVQWVSRLDEYSLPTIRLAQIQQWQNDWQRLFIGG